MVIMQPTTFKNRVACQDSFTNHAPISKEKEISFPIVFIIKGPPYLVKKLFMGTKHHLLTYMGTTVSNCSCSMTPVDNLVKGWVTWFFLYVLARVSRYTKEWSNLLETSSGSDMKQI